ncbi:thioredoxin family protein [Chryseobacterium camelliae]|uniref:thioredoxin family protein n=1 Tax=Chryseobacterium camelliae TaxID=1265445 RepID=UPI00285ABBAE|nr:thioredoxin family protein [Chryseobacterium camelliae]MDR6515330.1 thioredoxin-related protein [Chryseobacterium camelliae]
MKKLSLIAFLSLSTAVFSQKVKGNTENKSNSSKAVPAKTDADTEARIKAAQEKAQLPKPYDAKADADADLQQLISKAAKENKNIMIQAGGNWCIWCLRFNNFVQTTPELKKIVDDNYLYYHLNYSPDNKNEKIFSQYGNPGDKYGYPVFIVLDKRGKMIHVQPSDVLEEGKGYSLEKVKTFLQNWVSKS